MKIYLRTIWNLFLKIELKRLFILIFGLAIISCSKENEDDIYNLSTILFHNVSIDELQYVTIIGYEKNGKFDKIIDSSFGITNFNYEKHNWYTHEGILSKPINTGLDYKIVFEDIKDSCLITDIKEEKKICSQFLFIRKYSYSIDGYTMNGLRFACPILKAFPTRSE